MSCPSQLIESMASPLDDDPSIRQSPEASMLVLIMLHPSISDWVNPPYRSSLVTFKAGGVSVARGDSGASSARAHRLIKSTKSPPDNRKASMATWRALTSMRACNGAI